MKSSKSKKTLIISDYDRVYQTLFVCKKVITGQELYLFTVDQNINKIYSGFHLIARKHPKGGNFFAAFQQIYSLRKYHFDSIVVDYGFNIISLLVILLVRTPQLYILDVFLKKPLRALKISELIKIIFKNYRLLINKILIKYSMETKRTKALGFPIELSIESSSICDLKCQGCPTGLKLLSRPQGLMKLSKLDELLEKNKKYLKYVERVFPFLYGESLLNADIFKMIKTIRKYVSERCFIVLHTHGSFDEPEKLAGQIIESEIDQISISLDGPDKETYERFRVGGDFEKVCEFIKTLVRAREKNGRHSPEIFVQMILTKLTENMVEKMQDLCKDLKADRLLLKGYWYEFNLSDENSSKELNPDSGSLNPYDLLDYKSSENAKKAYSERKNNHCGWVYKSMVINWDGSVAPCCVDSDGKLLNAENIFNSDIKKVWNSSSYQELRRQINKGEVELCSKCFMS